MLSQPDALADFVALNEPATRRRVEREGEYFVVEGLLAIERLLGLPQWHVRSLVLLPRLVERIRDRAAEAGVEIAVADEGQLRAVVGFDLHRGALASVDRRAPMPLEDLLTSAPDDAGHRRRPLYVVTEGVNDHENLGAIYRNAAAFGAGGVLLDATSADPFYRRSIRVSLGHVLAVPTGTVGDLPAGLDALHAAGVTTVALTPSADVDLRDLGTEALGAGPVALLVGAEGAGLTPATLAAARHRVAIPMAPGVDSINVAAATAIALHHLCGRPTATGARATHPGDRASP